MGRRRGSPQDRAGAALDSLPFFAKTSERGAENCNQIDENGLALEAHAAR